MNIAPQPVRVAIWNSWACALQAKSIEACRQVAGAIFVASAGQGRDSVNAGRWRSGANLGVAPCVLGTHRQQMCAHGASAQMRRSRFELCACCL